MSGNKKRRQRTREALRKKHGDNCYWCGEPMDFIILGEDKEQHARTATIEHHNVKMTGNDEDLRLAHKECNI